MFASLILRGVPINTPRLSRGLLEDLMSPQSAEDTGGSNLATSVKAKVKQLQEAQARTDARAKEIEILDVGLTTREHGVAERSGDVGRGEKAQEEFVRTQSERVASLQRREEQLAASEQSVQL